MPKDVEQVLSWEEVLFQGVTALNRRCLSPVRSKELVKPPVSMPIFRLKFKPSGFQRVVLLRKDNARNLHA
jgi:hypothetical protein